MGLTRVAGRLLARNREHLLMAARHALRPGLVHRL